MRTVLTPRAVILAGLLLLLVGHVAVLAYHLLNLDKFRTHWTPEALSILQYCYIVSIFGLVPVSWFLLRLRRAGRAVFADIQSWLPRAYGSTASSWPSRSLQWLTPRTCLETAASSLDRSF